MVAGPLAAAVAVALVGASPFAVRYASLVMSDAFAAALAVLTLALVHAPTGAGWSAAGLLGGAVILVRLRRGHGGGAARGALAARRVARPLARCGRGLVGIVALAAPAVVRRSATR